MRQSGCQKYKAELSDKGWLGFLLSELGLDLCCFYFQRDFDEVVNEMREVGSLFMLAKPLLNKKGVTDKEVADFRSKIISVIRAGKAKDANQVNVSLKEVQEAYKSLMALFT